MFDRTEKTMINDSLKEEEIELSLVRQVGLAREEQNKCWGGR